MKFAGHTVEGWPAMLTRLKRLCGFFRNRSWRRVIVRMGSGLYEGLAKLMKVFNARLAKWRYETCFNVFAQLLKLRDFATTVLKDNIQAWFPNFKDKDLLKEVYDCLCDVDLWVFFRVFHDIIFWPLEKARRWGLVCACCSDQRHDTGKRSKCVMASRRLHQARLYLMGVKSKLSEAGNHIDLEFAEGILWIARAVSFTARKTFSDLKYKTTYFDNAPWRVAEARDPVQAGIVAEQLQNGNVERFTPLELGYRNRLLPDLMVILSEGLKPHATDPTQNNINKKYAKV